MQSRNYQDLSRGDDDRGERQAGTDQGDMEEYSNYGMRDDRHQGAPHGTGQHSRQPGGFVDQGGGALHGQRSGGYGGYGGGSFGADQGDRHADPDYHQWRQEQMRQLNGDYEAWRQERSSKFAEDFGQWRNHRRRAQGNQTSTTVGALGSAVSNQGPGGASGALGSAAGSGPSAGTDPSPSGSGAVK